MPIRRFRYLKANSAVQSELRKSIIYMSILLLTKNANWQQISDVVMRISGQCKDAPHYLWIEEPRLPVFAVELETLLRNLDLEEQWAYIETETEQPDDVSRIVDASDANWSRRTRYS